MSQGLLSRTVDELLCRAGASIRFRLRGEVLGSRADDHVMEQLHRQIIRDPRVTHILSWQQPDGYLGDVFHGGVSAILEQKKVARGAEGAIRLLSELGVRSTYRPFRRALAAIVRPDWFRNTLGVCWKYYPDLGMYGLDMVRAATLVSAGVEDHDFIRQQEREALRTLLGVVKYRSMDAIIEDFKGRKVFKPGVLFPEIYHLRLLGRSVGWKNSQTVALLARAVEHLVGLSPFPVVKVRYKSRWLGPAALYPSNLRRSLSRLSPREWWQWFHTFELFARMGIVPHVPCLRQQAQELVCVLESGNGFFRMPVEWKGCINWGPYSGLSLEPFNDRGRLVYDLTFRSILILHHTGMLAVK